MAVSNLPLSLDLVVVVVLLAVGHVIAGWGVF